MPIIVVAACLGSAAFLRYLADRGARQEESSPRLTEAEADLPTLRHDAETGEWRL